MTRKCWITKKGRKYPQCWHHKSNGQDNSLLSWQTVSRGRLSFWISVNCYTWWMWIGWLSVSSKAQWIQPSQRANKNQSPCQRRHRCHEYAATTVHGQGMAGQDKRILRGKLKSKWKWLKVAEIMYLFFVGLHKINVTWSNDLQNKDKQALWKQKECTVQLLFGADHLFLSWFFLMGSRTLDSALSKSMQNIGQEPLAVRRNGYLSHTMTGILRKSLANDHMMDTQWTRTMIP